MTLMKGLSVRGCNRILEIERLPNNQIYISVHHPLSGEGWNIKVHLQDLWSIIIGLENGENIQINGQDGSTMVEFSTSQFTKAQDRSGYSKVWVRPIVLDESRRSGKGWRINVPTKKLERVLQQEIKHGSP
jgi:hypothetical protein